MFGPSAPIASSKHKPQALEAGMVPNRTITKVMQQQAGKHVQSELKQKEKNQ